MYTSVVLILFNIFNTISTQYSQCPRNGKYGQQCLHYDYCNITAGLVCGDGTCGQSSCPPNWIRYNDSCYLFNNKTELNYQDSVINCKKMRSNLLNIDKQDKLNIIFKFIKSFSIWNVYFIDTNPSQDIYVFKTTTNVTYYQNSSFWCSTEPNNILGMKYNGSSELCLSVSHNNIAGCFKDVPCNIVMYSFCEFDLKPCNLSTCQCLTTHYWDNNTCKLLKTYNNSCAYSYECDAKSGLTCISSKCSCNQNLTWSSSAYKCMPCPNDFFLINNSCYLIKQEDYIENATKQCESVNGSLVKINDLNSFIFYKNLIDMFQRKYYIWTSAKSTGNYLQFKWSDQTVVETITGVLNWCPGEPNNFNKSNSSILEPYVAFTTAYCLADVKAQFPNTIYACRVKL